MVLYFCDLHVHVFDVDGFLTGGFVVVYGFAYECISPLLCLFEIGFFLCFDLKHSSWSSGDFWHKDGFLCKTSHTVLWVHI